MLESIAVLLGRNVRLPGVHSLIRTMFPVGKSNGRHVKGVRARSDGLNCYVDSRDWIDWNVLFSGSYEPHIASLFEHLLQPGGTAIDVGANVGMHALTLARIVGSSGTVVAFEPNPAARMRLEQNVALNGFGHVRIDARALGDERVRSTLRVPAAGSAEACNQGMASLVALETPHDLVEVDVAPLDAIAGEFRVDRVDVVKIDVQGYEVHVLRGMSSVIERFRPAIIFEYEDWAWKAAGCRFEDAISMLVRWDYVAWMIEPRGEARFDLAPVSSKSVAHVEWLALPRVDARASTMQALLRKNAHG